MKRICALTVVIFFLVGGLNVFAQDITAITQNSTIHINYVYNAYGVAISSTDKTTTTTRTEYTDEEEEGGIGWSETTTLSITESAWIGGSLKIKSASGTSETTSKDGAASHTDFWTNYEYNENGQLKGASGGATTKGDRGKDGNGQPIGTYESSTVDNYILKNGSALRSSSVTTGTNYGSDGKKTSDFTETTNYDYELIAGSWHLTKEVSTSTSNEVNGNTQAVTKTKTYQRDNNGVCTAISQTATGTYKAVNESGGSTTYTMKNYTAEFKYDSKAGWYLANEKWDWEQ